jgi:hypothetical protein
MVSPAIAPGSDHVRRLVNAVSRNSGYLGGSPAPVTVRKSGHPRLARPAHRVDL